MTQMASVSYTHLDVYKRQVCRFVLAMHWVDCVVSVVKTWIVIWVKDIVFFFLVPEWISTSCILMHVCVSKYWFAFGLISNISWISEYVCLYVHCVYILHYTCYGVKILFFLSNKVVLVVIISNRNYVLHTTI